MAKTKFEAPKAPSESIAEKAKRVQQDLSSINQDLALGKDLRNTLQLKRVLKESENRLYAIQGQIDLEESRLKTAVSEAEQRATVIEQDAKNRAAVLVQDATKIKTQAEAELAEALALKDGVVYVKEHEAKVREREQAVAKRETEAEQAWSDAKSTQRHWEQRFAELDSKAAAIHDLIRQTEAQGVSVPEKLQKV